MQMKNGSQERPLSFLKGHGEQNLNTIPEMTDLLEGRDSLRVLVVNAVSATN